MSVAKVTINGTTILDLTDATATSGSDVVSPKTAYSPTGTKLTGTAEVVNNQTATRSYTPSESRQTDTITPDSSHTGLSSVSITVDAMPSGSAGTPTATKGAVSNHSVSVTPSVTNTTGYITGSTKTGTAVTVSASELVSGSQTITENDTYDVTNLASVTVNVSGGASSWTLVKSAEMTITQASTSNTNKGTIACGSEIFTKDDWIWVRIRDKAGNRAGYMYGTDTIFANANKANGSTSTYTAKMTTVIRYSTSSQWACYIGNYGVYAYSITNSGNIAICARYSSSNTLTIDGTYVIEVYKLTPPTGKTIFA